MDFLLHISPEFNWEVGNPPTNELVYCATSIGLNSPVLFHHFLQLALRSRMIECCCLFVDTHTVALTSSSSYEDIASVCKRNVAFVTLCYIGTQCGSCGSRRLSIVASRRSGGVQVRQPSGRNPVHHITRWSHANPSSISTTCVPCSCVLAFGRLFHLCCQTDATTITDRFGLSPR